jgi:hypothetical protein
MPPVPTSIASDFADDQGLRNLLVGQSRNPQSPFGIAYLEGPVGRSH